MLTISKLAERFRNIDTNRIINESLDKTSGEFENIQRDQLLHGKTKKGDAIKPYYRNRKYAEAKHEMNPLPGLGTPDLRLTGAFHEAIDVEVGHDMLDIISKDEKGPELEHKYPDIFGLGGTYKKKYLTEHLGPSVREKISNFTGLKFQ